MPIPESVPLKRRQILAGARQVFGELGFERASVDLIASRAGVSKATVYNHFEDKKALFVAAVVQECEDMRAGLQRCREKPVGDVEQSLRALGEKVMGIFLSPSIAGLYRQAIAESARLPEIGRLVFERGTASVQDAVASHLARWNETGALRIDDARAAAIDFVGLCQGDLGVRSRLGLLEYPVDDEVRETVRRAVGIFVRAYRP
ncbi:TetR/AcrR family transcriptional regulator [Anaeromyxobacter oryzae]|uniref:TetR family transcriptional regulator n=1 Tax=Anaeromyxobacter oryzae TaxID=2918170 RepID=A0ABN6N0W5_9BACT|nr:TetR/AcrR family transcriptional regulator [Anaeromyxobacter oryzae]BDG05580.1 TetR family transcriptional regulator [Anaeromyxobacter oryzae]